MRGNPLTMLRPWGGRVRPELISPDPDSASSAAAMAAATATASAPDGEGGGGGGGEAEISNIPLASSEQANPESFSNAAAKNLENPAQKEPSNGDNDADMSSSAQIQRQSSRNTIASQRKVQQQQPESCEKTSTIMSRSGSVDSLTEYCRICQQPSEECLIELGCQCRGELAKVHRPCIQQWFNNKGSNKCEVCQHVAANIPPPATQPLQSFWIWRTNAQNVALLRRRARVRFHPLWAALLIIITGLLFDVLFSVFIGGSLPVNIIIGVLVVVGIGTGVRLIIECLQERRRRRRRRRELEQLQTIVTTDQIHATNFSATINVYT